MSGKRWRCFFCDEVFTNAKDAGEHFGLGLYELEYPGCVDPLRTDEKERLRGVRELIAQRERESERLEFLEGVYAEIPRYFGKDVTTVHLAYDRYRSALNLVEALEERLKEVAHA